MFLPKHCFPCTFWRCDENLQRIKAALHGKIEQGFDRVFFILVHPPPFLRASQRNKRNILLSSSTDSNEHVPSHEVATPHVKTPKRENSTKSKILKELGKMGLSLKLLQVKGVRSSPAP